MLYLSAIFACRGNSSQTSMPGTLVLIGMNSPRYSLGASGFMSYISMCGGPPGSQTKITEVSLPDTPGAAFFACASSKPERPSPHAVPPTSRNDRRETGPGQNAVPSLIALYYMTLGFVLEFKKHGALTSSPTSVRSGHASVASPFLDPLFVARKGPARAAQFHSHHGRQPRLR